MQLKDPLKLSRRQATKGLVVLGGGLFWACSDEGSSPPQEGSDPSIETSPNAAGPGDASFSASDAASGPTAMTDASATSTQAGGPDAGSAPSDGGPLKPSDAGTTASSDAGSVDAGNAAEDAGNTLADAASTSPGGWAGGGTKSMADSYPDPFPTGISSCALLVPATAGPCTEAADMERTDISEGYTGLPLRLSLRVVNAACEPLSDAKVKIWHTQINGSYSGDTPNPGMCLKDQSDSAKHYFRGVQYTDGDGRVDFNSCFPGWYRGRCIHIHFTVTKNGKSFTSQIIFEQELVNEIFSDHEEYAPYGLPDTLNARDNVVGNANLDTYLAHTARMNDGVMVAYKDLIVSV